MRGALPRDSRIASVPVATNTRAEAMPASSGPRATPRTSMISDRAPSRVSRSAASRSAAGVQIFIGGESDTLPLDECSLVTAPYEVDGQVVGTLGVIGPTRMAYERVIPLVDITARLLSNALSYH